MGDIYTADNVVLSATHTHSGPAGFLQYILFEVSSLGFIPQTCDAMIYGITRVRIDVLTIDNVLIILISVNFVGP